MILGVVLLVLAATGAISRFARLIPQSVSVGLQLGLGLLMAILGAKLILETPWIGGGALILLFLLLRVPRCPVAPIVLAAAICAGWLSGVSAPPSFAFGWPAPEFVVPSWPELWQSIELAVLPQLSLTLTNAVIVTAALARELFPMSGEAASERRLALSSGVANVLLCPFGAMPMCHGAGGLQAQYRFGARTGLAPILFGSALLVLAIGFADSAAASICGRSRRRGRSALDPGGHRSGRLAPPVRCEAVLLAGDRRSDSGDGVSSIPVWDLRSDVRRNLCGPRSCAASDLRFPSKAQPGPAAPVLDGARRLRGKCGTPVAFGGTLT